jgi:predicted TPR repeat methyltransferase
MTSDVDPNDLVAGWQHYRAGRLSEAEAASRVALTRDAADPEALHLLGAVLASLQQTELAVLLLERAAQLRPDDASFLRTLGAAHAMRGNFDEALAAYDRALETNPDDALTMAQRGSVLIELGRTDEALGTLRRAAELRPESGDCQIQLANGLLAAGQPDEARAAYRRALAADAGYANWHVRTGEALYASGAADRALRMYQSGLALGSTNPELPHLAAALAGDNPERPSDAYVAALFDRMADHFDETLVQRLHYRVPEQLTELLTGLLPAGARGDLDILDAGCGTGLAGPLLRPLARRLIGLDLSPRMVDHARERGVYDEVVVGEITEALREQPATWDVIIAADAIIYFGDLGELVSAAARALRAGGRLVFSLERTDGRDYELRPSGRYAHSREYIAGLARAAGLDEEAFTETELRHEGSNRVAGYLAVFARASAVTDAR